MTTRPPVSLPRPPSPLNLHPQGENADPADSDSSTSSPDPECDDDGEYFMLHDNDSQSTVCAVTPGKGDEAVMDVEELHRVTPIAKLPPELLIAIFARLSTTADLRSCMLVSYHWALYCVSILWHRPLCNKWPNLQNVARTLSAARPTFPYHEMVKRLNLSAVAKKVNNGTAQAFMNCKNIERLTLTNCSELSDFGVAGLVDGCRRLQALDVTDLDALTDETMLAVARNCAKLQGLNITKCDNVTDESVVAIAEQCRQLKRLKLNGVSRITDEAVTAVARHCRSVLEIDLTSCHAITSTSVTALLAHLPYLRELRLAHCPDVTDTAFTNLPPQLHFDALRLLDLTQCEQVRDDAIARIIPAAPKLRNLVLSKCRHITDRAVEAICKLTKNLHYIHLGHCVNLTDAAVINLVKHCNRIRYIDLACCSRLTDASVRHLAQLPKLRRIGLVKCQNLTDLSILALAHSPLIFGAAGKLGGSSPFVSLERVHLSYCVNLTRKGITELLHNCPRLTHLSLTGVQAFLQEDVTRFCRQAPPEFTHLQRDVFCVFSGDGVTRLRDYLEEAERQHQHAIDESLLDPEDSPTTDTMSDDGTVDGHDHGADLVYGPGRRGLAAGSDARRPRPLSVQMLPDPPLERPRFENEPFMRPGAWALGDDDSPPVSPSFHPGYSNLHYVPPPDAPSRWQAISGHDMPQQLAAEARARAQTRRHTESSAAFMTPSPRSFNLYVTQSPEARDLMHDADLSPSSLETPGPPTGAGGGGGPVRSPRSSLGPTPTAARRRHLGPTDPEHMAFDAHHDAIMSTIPSVGAARPNGARSASPLLARERGRRRTSNLLGGAGSLASSPLSQTDFPESGSSGGHGREGGLYRRADPHRDAMLRAMMATELGDYRSHELPPLAAEGDPATPLLPRDLMEEVNSSPNTSVSSTRVPTPLHHQHPPTTPAENQDVNMTN